jgi:senataxin
LEATLQDIDKFSRRANNNYRTRLSDDYLSELASLLDPFELGLADDEVQSVREQKTSEPSASSKDRDFKPLPPPEPVLVTKRNAFDVMMKKGGSKTPSSSQTSSPAQPDKKTTSSSKPKEGVIDIDDDDEFGDDSWLEQLSGGDLEIMEKKAKISTTMPKTAYPKPAFPLRRTPAAPAAQKLNIDLVRRKPVVVPTFKSKFMQEARRDLRVSQVNRAQIGGITPKQPAASLLGTGLGAYRAPSKITRKEESGSSASESSDEDNKGIKALADRQKTPPPVKRFQIEAPRKVMNTAMDDVYRQREERRNAQHRIKQRLRPDITDLHRYVLSWDPQHVGPTPPYHAQYTAALSKLGPVPSTFSGAKQYEQIMLPLFLQELWSQSQQEKPSFDAPMVVEVAARQYDDGFVDIDVFSKQMYGSFVTDSDVVILSQPGQDAIKVMAKVQAFKKKQNVATIKLRVSTLMDRNQVVAKTSWQMTKLFS